MVDTDILLVDGDQDTCASLSDISLDLGYTVDMAYDGPGTLELSGGAPVPFGTPRLQDARHGRPRTLPTLEKLPAERRGYTHHGLRFHRRNGSAGEAGVRCSLLKPVNFAVLMPLVKEVVGTVPA
jgi:CheY-like chemotaxis protein